jgi:hypothetical protein
MASSIWSVFATSFSWWFASPSPTFLEPASAGLLDRAETCGAQGLKPRLRSPAKAGSDLGSLCEANHQLKLVANGGSRLKPARGTADFQRPQRNKSDTTFLFEPPSQAQEAANGS